MVILINGSINSGKTTISKALVKRLNRAAHIEVDNLREFINNISLEEAIPINIENTILVARNLIEHKFDVIISYPLNEEQTRKIVEELKENDNKIYYFSLSPKLEKTLTNRGKRKLTKWEIERIKYHYNEGVNNPGFGIVIDNTNQSIEETTDEIINRINKGFVLDTKSKIKTNE